MTDDLTPPHWGAPSAVERDDAPVHESDNDFIDRLAFSTAEEINRDDLLRYFTSPRFARATMGQIKAAVVAHLKSAST